MIKIHLGDCRKVIPVHFPDDTFTGIVTDPPYELGFMGKKWDRSGVAFEVDVWREALRVCRPGSPLFAFGGTRSYHRLACAIEDAGWIIRDSIQVMCGIRGVVEELAASLNPDQIALLGMVLDQQHGQRLHSWLYGSGMPKGQAIGKAMDRAAGAEREVTGTYQPPPDSDYWKTGFKTDFAGEPYERAGSVLEGLTKQPLTAPATPAAKLWEGWHTGLAPAWEPIICAMKPLDGTFVENAQAHGVAGLNVDGSRTGTTKAVPASPSRMVNRVLGDLSNDPGTGTGHDPNVGRWPANLLLDAAAAEMLDEAVGDRKAGGDVTGLEPSSLTGGTREVFSDRPSRDSFTKKGDTGGPSRYFPTVERFHYSGKATSRDRGHRVEKAAPLFDVQEDTEVRCKHPTVKPLSVCEWLVRLAMMPENTRILDLFAGTAQVGKACIRFGVDYDGIEIDPESHAWAEDQLRRAKR